MRLPARMRVLQLNSTHENSKHTRSQLALPFTELLPGYNSGSRWAWPSPVPDPSDVPGWEWPRSLLLRLLWLVVGVQ